MAKTYKVEIIETLSRIVEVEAPDEYQAAEIVADMYANEKIVLDASDYRAVCVEIVEI